MSTPTIPVNDWHNCYADHWRGFITDDSYSHPAKFARGLVARIFRHGKERGYWREQDVIGDPFGGIGGGGIVGTWEGMRWIGVELEPRFVTMARANFAIHHRGWRQLCRETPRIFQGDSRQFDQIVRIPAGLMRGVVTSPPYGNSLDAGGSDTAAPDQSVRAMQGRKDRYGTTPGQIGKLAGVVTSPPYGDSSQNYAAGYKTIDFAKAVHNRYSRQREAEYGKTDGQIGTVKTESYWQAMAQVYGAVFRSLEPGGYMACVVKDYVKNKARVPLCDTTLDLLVATGFEPVERCRAWLTKETREAGTFAEIVTTKSRKSFFRRLAEKNGSPRIDFEEVLWVRVPA